MNRVLEFINNHPIGVAIKVGIAAMLAWLLANADAFDLHPILVVGLVPVIVAVIDWLNPQNDRFGVGS